MSNVFSFEKRTAIPVEELHDDEERAVWEKAANKFLMAASLVGEKMKSGELRTVLLLSEDYTNGTDIHNFCDPDPVRLIGLLQYQQAMMVRMLADFADFEDPDDGDETPTG